jgi:hypothetical protein
MHDYYPKHRDMVGRHFPLFNKLGFETAMQWEIVHLRRHMVTIRVWIGSREVEIISMSVRKFDEILNEENPVIRRDS